MIGSKPGTGVAAAREGRTDCRAWMVWAGKGAPAAILATVLVACATAPPPPPPPMVEPGLFAFNLPKTQTIEFVSIPSTATCTLIGDKANDLGSFSGRRVFNVSHFNEAVTISCSTPGFRKAVRKIPAEKTQASSGVGAVVLIGILAGPAAAASTAVKMRRERALWWYPPIVHVVLEPDPNAPVVPPKRAPARKAGGTKPPVTAAAADAAPDPRGEVASARETVKNRWEKFIARQTKICDGPNPHYRYCVKRDFPRFRDKDLAAIGATGQ